MADYYVDPAINGDSGTGAIGDPFGDLQYALNTVTRDTTNGDRFNVKAGTAELVSSVLSFSTYGSPTSAAPCMFQGYTATAGDGGVGEISGGGSSGIINGTQYLGFIDMKLGNCGGNHIVNIGVGHHYYNCEFHTTSQLAIFSNSGNLTVLGCWFHTISSVAANRGGIFTATATIAHCVIDISSCSNGAAILTNGNLINITGNIIIAGSGGNGVVVSSGNRGVTITNNSVYGSNSTRVGITGAVDSVIVNNIVEGFSGAGGVGISFTRALLYGANAFYNNTTNESAGTILTNAGGNDSLAASPFVAAGSGDFDIDGTVVGVTEDGWPSGVLGASSTAPKIDKGAVQAGAGSGGGGLMYPVVGASFIRGAS